MIRLRWLAFVAILAVPTIADAQAPETIEVTGIVVEEATGLPVPAVAVGIPETRIGTVTDSAGRYTLRGVPNRNAIVTARRIGYIPEMRALWVCTPVLHPGGGCTPASAEDREVRFFMRSALPPRVR